MKKITIKVPQKKEKWQLSWGIGGNTKKMITATSLFNVIERRLLRTHLKEKTTIVVKYAKDTSNETISSLNPYYLLHVLGCFLEDYISKQTLKRISKDYFKKGELL